MRENRSVSGRLGLVITGCAGCCGRRAKSYSRGKHRRVGGKLWFAHIRNGAMTMAHRVADELVNRLVEAGVSAFTALYVTP